MALSYLENTPIQKFLENLYSELSIMQGGEIADYIPELTRAKPEWLGITIATVDGHIYQVGESRQPFTIQSISKAITYGMALEDRGLEHVLNKVGVEPSGEAFNSISLEPKTGRPLNPMINAGAIATTGLIKATDGKAQMDRILETFGRYTGTSLKIDDKVYQSESNTGHRNRAIAHLMYGHDILDRPPEEILDLYFRQCSMLVSARDLALMGACLANNGVNPVTGVIALKSHYVEKVLSVMNTCGMYDFSGGWIFNVGMPAKSGVGGGIMAVLPGQFGLGVFSPPLDQKGNSVRGIEACKKVSGYFKLHLFNVARSTSASVIRSTKNCQNIRSRRSRTDIEEKILSREGEKIHVYELQGELMFGASESISQQIFSHFEAMDFLIIDMMRVFEIDESAVLVLGQMTKSILENGKTVFFTNIRYHSRFKRRIEKLYRNIQEPSLFHFKDNDRALEWCENNIINHSPISDKSVNSASNGLSDQYLCTGFSPNELVLLASLCSKVSFKKGDYVFRTGDGAESMFFILQGEVEVCIKTNANEILRISTIGSGMCFGEVSLVSDGQRTADILALTETDCLEMPFAALEGEIKTKFVLNLASHLARKIARDTKLLQHVA